MRPDIVPSADEWGRQIGRKGMTQVLTHMCMSLDGYVAQPDDNPAELFDWYWNGNITLPSAQEGMNFSVDVASAAMLRDLMFGLRRAHRRAVGCSTSPTAPATSPHPVGAPVVVVTHRPPPETPRSGSREPPSLAASRMRSRRRKTSPATTRRDRQRQHHPAGPQPGPRRRAVHQPGAGAVRQRVSATRRTRWRPSMLKDPVVVQGTRATAPPLQGAALTYQWPR